jgi:hypothetical protein
MAGRDTPTGQFAATFPARFAGVMADARGAMAGIEASMGNGTGLIPPEGLERLHDIYRLRVELEIETANLLWRTAEVVCALTDAIESLNRRTSEATPPPQRWLGGVPHRIVERRRARVAMQDDEVRRETRWPDFGAPLRSAPPDQRPVASPEGDRQWPAWDREPDPGSESEAA